MIFDKVFKNEGMSLTKEPFGIEKISIRECILSNPDLFNKEIRNIKFPPNCRIFIIIRDSKEIIPEGDTALREDDTLVLGGIKSNQDEMVNLITNQKSSSMNI